MPTYPDNHSPSGLADNKALPKLTLNPDEYREHLAGFELTEAQENELLQVLWQIMSTMVDIGWGVDTVQMFLPDMFEKAGADSDKLLPITTPSFNAEASGPAKEEAND